ncbi:hypothetical protein DPMN_011843 [Dreissena polymorpha]|uniref:Uncharacterized protein n=1 Tax=Dreissena polymorpha TaxID=45954 RepID=A0A9D4S0Q6_DREPO|nr:hypothetical protein DPMN_011843 [Dreissena polymorpha]
MNIAVALTLLTLTVAGTLAGSTCRDRYIWWADGSVDCLHLTEPSLWGMHKDPDYWCNHYSLTDCCATCTALRNEGVIPG